MLPTGTPGADLLIGTYTVVFPSCLLDFKEQAAQQPCIKGVLVLPFFPPSYFLLLSAKRVNSFPAFSMARSVAKLVAVVLRFNDALFSIGLRGGVWLWPRF